jgi:hypothetical protein
LLFIELGLKNDRFPGLKVAQHNPVSIQIE